MKLNTYLIVSNRGAVRFNKTGAGVKSNEIALLVKLDVPDAFFKRPVPMVDIKVPAGLIEQLTPEASVELSASAVAQALGVSVDEAHDGLTAILQNHDGFLK